MKNGKYFRLLRDGTEEGKRNERLGELKLFQNNLGDYVHLKNILGTTDQSWLFPFQIKSEESHPDVNRYLISNKNFFYERIIFPFWPVLSKQIVEKDFEKQTQIFKEISRCYNLTEVSKEEELQLYKKKVVFFQGESSEVENLFYHPDLKMIDKENYKSVQKSVLEYLDVVIPDYEYLELYSEAPFQLESTCDGFPVEGLDVPLNEAKDLLQFWNTCNIKILGHFVIKSSPGDTLKFYKTEGKNFWTQNSKLKDYILSYHENALLPLPAIFDEFSDLVTFSNNNLFVFLIKNIDVDNEQQFVRFTEACLQESDERLVKLLEIAPNIELDTHWSQSDNNTIYLRLFKRLLQADSSKISDVQKKIVFKISGGDVPLNSIDSANDRILIEYQNKKVNLSRSLILNLKDNNSLAEIQKFATEAIDRNILTEKETQLIFKLRKENITEELVLQFLRNSNKKISNTDQLLLVLTTKDRFKHIYNELKILNKENRWSDFEGNWILPNSQFGKYDYRYEMSDAYQDLSERLQLGKYEGLYYRETEQLDGEEDVIMPFFQFRKGATSKVFRKPRKSNPIFKGTL